MIQKLCYVDPLYFIEHKLYNKINDPACAYFDLFPETLIKKYSPVVSLEDYPHYIASGMYDNLLYYDVCKHKTNDTYNLLISSNISITSKQQIIYVYIDFNKDTPTKDYTAMLAIIEYKTETGPGSPSRMIQIYFDTFQDLFGIIKNTIRQNTIQEMESK